MKRWEISAFQAGWLTAGAVVLTGHALAVTHFMQAGGRDAWISGLINMPLLFLAAWSLYRLRLIFPRDTIVQYLPKVLGVVGYPVAAIYVTFLFGAVLFTLRMTTDWMVDSILPETPALVISGLYMAAVVYAALSGLDVLARINQFTLPLLALLGMTVSVSTMQAKDYRLLFPLLEKGPWPLLSASVLALGFFGETSIMGMYDAYVLPEDRKKLFRAYIFPLLFIVTTFTGPLAGSIATLGHRVAADMPYPTFQHWLMVSYARFFERTDLLAVHQWLAGAYVRSGIYLLMAVQGLYQLFSRTTLQKRLPAKWLIPGAAAAVVALSEKAIPSQPVFDTFVLSIYLPTTACLGILLPPLLLAIAWIRGLTRTKRGAQIHGA
jgi:spore germination protein KB